MAQQRSPSLKRESWPRRVWGFWLDHRWTALAVLWGVAFVLGVVGFGRYHASRAEPRGLMDLVYLSLQLFVLESGAVFGPAVGLDLQIARILAPAVTLVSLYQAVSKIVGEQLSRARTWGLKGHVVIAGLGEKGALLAQAYRDEGQSVLVIERQADVDALDRTRERGILVLVGDATNTAIQRRARVQTAAMLIAVAGDESTNAEIARTAREVSLTRSSATGRLASVVHILDSHLWNLLRTLDLDQHERFQVEFLNLFQIGALELLADDAVRAVADPDRPPPAPHILVVGAGWFGQTLAMRAARLWKDQPKSGTERMHITLLDRASTFRKEELLFRYPEIESVADVTAIELEVPSSVLERPSHLLAPDRAAGPTAIYVCLDDDTRGLYAGLALRRAFPDESVPITVRTRREWGIARLAERGLQSVASGQVRIFPLLDRTCRPMLAQRTALNDVLARLTHAEYLRTLERQRANPADKPNMRSWSELSDEAQNWNRTQAAHIPVKLELLGCRAVPTPDWDVPLYEIPKEKVDEVAMVEHERWMKERVDAGWKWGPENNATRPNPTNPSIVPWDMLDEATREYDRSAVLGIPAFLAKAGYQVVEI